MCCNIGIFNINMYLDSYKRDNHYYRFDSFFKFFVPFVYIFQLVFWEEVGDREMLAIWTLFWRIAQVVRQKTKLLVLI